MIMKARAVYLAGDGYVVRTMPPEKDGIEGKCFAKVEGGKGEMEIRPDSKTFTDAYLAWDEIPEQEYKRFR